MSTVHNGHPIFSQLHAPILVNRHLFQLDIPALTFSPQPAAMSTVHKEHPIVSQLHAPITANGHPIVSQLHAPIANENVFQLEILAVAFISRPAATNKIHVGRLQQ